MRRSLFLGVLLAFAVGCGYWWWQGQQPTRFHFRTAAIERGPFLAFISATGPIEPVEVIDVGAQVTGFVERFGADPRSQKDLCVAAAADAWTRPMLPAGLLVSGLVPTKTIDYGSPVEVGTILAQLDASLYRTEVEESRAELALARAQLEELKIRQAQAERDWTRARELALTKAIAPTDFEIARLGYDVACAGLTRGKATVEKAEASYKRAEINLNYTTIRAPVKGVVIDRRVSVGQTVNSSQNAPSLFLLGTDLSRLQVWASVNEADIGQIVSGQAVQFTADAYPGEVFFGTVAVDQPRFNATMTQNVVTYTVVVDVDNSDQRISANELVVRSTKKKMLPYLTANVKFIQTQKTSALLIPNSALRWRPQPRQVVAEARSAFEKSLRQRRSADAKDLNERTVWVEADGLVRPVRISIGHTDGAMTEILGGELGEGDHVVFGENLRADSAAGNPFGPPSFGPKKKEK